MFLEEILFIKFFFFGCLGIDAEDIEYLKRSYHAMLADEAQAHWLNYTHWVDHPVTDLSSGIPSKKARVHSTGSARTQGYYKIDATEKLRHKVKNKNSFFFF